MRVALFFDGSNFYTGLETRAPGLEVDYSALASWLVARVGGASGRLVRATYYTGVGDQPALERFLDGLELCPGYFVVRQPRVSRVQTCPDCGHEHRVQVEKRVDTRIVSDLLELAFAGAFDVAVLLSGDEDLLPGLDVAHRAGRSVHVATWGGHGLSPALRAAAYSHVDLLEGRDSFGTGRSRGEEVDDAVVLAEVDAGTRYFAARGGHLSRWYFVHRWSADSEVLPPGPARARAVERLLAAERIEVYAAEVNGREVAALRATGRTPGPPEADRS